ncbi:MAG: preprotein translocase subunit SecE [Isosphaeraceae bacterium]
MPEVVKVAIPARKSSAMGKVKDEVSASKQIKSKPGGASKGLFLLFLLNFLRSDLYKPMQGWYSRVYTAAGLGMIAAAGVWKIHDATVEYALAWRLGLPIVFAVILSWVVFRIIEFAPFAEFLIATEAEMNKVSWTTKDDLFRATTVVLSTVIVMAVFLYFVDTLWTFVLRVIGVLQFGGSGGFGSTA